MLNNNTGSSGYVDNDVVKGMSAEHQALWDEMFACRDEIVDIVSDGIRTEKRGVLGEGADVTIAAYLLGRISEFHYPFVSFEEAMRILDDVDVELAARKVGIPEMWERLLKLVKRHEPQVFHLVSNIRKLNDPVSTPIGVRDLALRLLDINEGDKFADLCCGGGAVARDAKSECPQAEVYACDHDRVAIGWAKAGNSFSNIKFERKDMFRLALEKEQKFDKIFANYPFRVRRNEGIAREYYDDLEGRYASSFKSASSDWMCNMVMVDLLSETGKAVGIMTNGATWNLTDLSARKYFVENGLIECVISLPARLLGLYNIPVSVILLSHGNKGVRLVDASEEFQAGRRVNELTEANVDQIMSLLKENSDKGRYVSLEELRDNDYSLNAGRYLNAIEENKTGILFGDVIKRITRGAPLNADHLDKLVSQVPTGMQYITLANVQNGLIDDDLPYMTHIDERAKRYCLSNHCLVVSKVGYPYKVAVAELRDGQIIMANGNLYIIELDKEKVDPYYLAAYLSSEQGTAALKAISVGAAMPNIAVESLRKMPIPLPDMEEQREIGRRYVTVRDEIAMLKLKLDRAKARMAHVWEKGGD